jgi:hypothetical protein
MFIRQGDMRGGRLGIFEVIDPLASIEVRDAATAELAAKMIDAWWVQHDINAERDRL